MKNGRVKYEVFGEYSDEHRLLQNIVVYDEVCTKEMLDRLGRQLAKQFANRLIVVVNVFAKNEATSRSSHRLKTVSTTTGVRDHLQARYVRSREIGLHQLMIYPGDVRLVPQVIRYP